MGSFRILDQATALYLTMKHPNVSIDKPSHLPKDMDAAVRHFSNAHHFLKRYQALYTDGVLAVLLFIQIPDLNSLFRVNKSRVNMASYTLPRDCNAFVCHLVSIVSSSVKRLIGRYSSLTTMTTLGIPCTPNLIVLLPRLDEKTSLPLILMS